MIIYESPFWLVFLLPSLFTLRNNKANLITHHVTTDSYYSIEVHFPDHAFICTLKACPKFVASATHKHLSALCKL
jgi:hypothetical protein